MFVVNDRLLLVRNALGIFVFYFCYGILHEKIMRGRYGDEINDGVKGERFTFAIALVGIQCCCFCIFAKVLLLIRNEAKDTTHQGYFASAAVVNLLAMVTGNMALKWVNYPTQVLAKSAKPIPVLIMGVLFAKKSYKLSKYFCVLIIVTGVGLFMYKSDDSVATSEEKFGWGHVLLMISLLMDGFLGVVQDTIRAVSKPSGLTFMFAINLWITIMLSTALVVTGEGSMFIQFARKYPNIGLHLSALVLTGCFGQLFICLMISQFGSLPTTITTTLRKFFTVLFSVTYFGNSLTLQQWFATFLVFFGLFTNILSSKKPIKTDVKVSEVKPEIQIAIISDKVPQTVLETK